jgi:tetratricopeptide (TPR) repeat protein
VLAIHREVLGNDSAHTARALNNLALMLEQLGRRVEALPFARESVEVFRAALGDDHPEVALALANLGTLLARMGRTAEAETALRDARAHFIARLGPDDLSLGPPQNNLAKLLLETGRAAEAREIAESTVRIYSAVLPAGHWRTAVATSVLAACWAAEGRTADAETALLESIGQIVAARGESNSSALWARERLAELYRRTGRSAEAVRLETAGTAER